MQFLDRCVQRGLAAGMTYRQVAKLTLGCVAFVVACIAFIHATAAVYSMAVM